MVDLFLIQYYSMRRYRGEKLSEQISKEDFLRIQQMLPQFDAGFINMMDYAWLCLALYTDETKPLDFQILDLTKKLKKIFWHLKSHPMHWFKRT